MASDADLLLEIAQNAPRTELSVTCKHVRLKRAGDLEQKGPSVGVMTECRDCGHRRRFEVMLPPGVSMREAHDRFMHASGKRVRG